MRKNKKGMIGGLVAMALGLVVGTILFVGVLIPITTTTVQNAGNVTSYYNSSSYNFTSFQGVNNTIASNLTTFILIGVLVLIAGTALYGLSRQ